jgi:PAS domain S-box-containing protein
MPQVRPTVSQTMVRHLNRMAMIAGIVLSLAVPATYATLSIHLARHSLDLETAQAARALDRIVMERPELWNYEFLRLQELIDQPTLEGGPEDRVVRTLEGQQVVRTTFQAPRPFIRSLVSVHDSGQEVGTIEARRSVRSVLFHSLIVTLASAAMGWGLFIVFRLLPIRTLGHAISDLSDERRKITAILKAIPDGIVAVDGEDRVLFLNPAAELLLGCTSEAAAGRPVAKVYPVRRGQESGPGISLDRAELQLGDAPPRIIEEKASPLPPEWSGRAGRVIVFRDITLHLKTEAELLRVRQIESLGVLAGGIAHDFNNYLSAILGNISLAMQDLLGSHRATDRLKEATKATDRARALALKLLTFAKGGDPARRVLALAPLVQEAAEFVTHGTAVQFTCTVQAGLWNAEVDEGLLSQVFHNLVINAVQAMQGQGQIRIHLENLRVEEDEILHLLPGRYLRVTLRDSGSGIPEAILPRIFEPYFTTKEAGHGLGLASCYNIMKAHGGNIMAESEPGLGAIFLVYVPATDKALDLKPAVILTPPPQGRGRVLVMEDDPVLQEIASEMLERMGFTAHTCPDGQSAIKAYARAFETGSPFQAVIMDLTIPGGMGGREAATHILAIDPNARLIVSSGYSVDPVMARPGEFGFMGTLPKPYSLGDLARVLDSVVLAHP